MTRDHLAAQLAVVASEAKVCEYDVRERKNWPGEVSERLSRIREALEKAQWLAERLDRGG